MSISAGKSDMRVASASVITTPLVVVSVVFPVLAALSIHLRLIAKRLSRQPFHSDDWWVIATWFLTLPMSVMFWVFSVKSGVDTYDIDSLQGINDSLEVAFLTASLLQFPLSSVKISVLLFYKRIFAISEKFGVCVWVTIGLITVWCIVFTVLVLTEVEPMSESWLGGRMRYDMAALGLAQVGSSIALDVIVLCFPLPIIIRMLLSGKKKFMVFLMFWLGAFCCVAAIIRLILLIRFISLKESPQTFFRSPQDIHRQSDQYIFMLIEPNCSIIAACLPCYGPLIERLHRRTSESTPSRDLSICCTHSRTSNKGIWGGGTNNRSFYRGSGIQFDSNVRFGWPGKIEYDARWSNGGSAWKS